MNFEFLSKLWDELVTNSLNGNEKDLMFNWLKELCDNIEKNFDHI